MQRLQQVSLSLLVALAAGCGGAQGMSPEYGYGDMFESDEPAESYRDEGRSTGASLAVTATSGGSYDMEEEAAYDRPDDDWGGEEADMVMDESEPAPEMTAPPSPGDSGRRSFSFRSRNIRSAPPPPPAPPPRAQAAAGPSTTPEPAAGQPTPAQTEPATTEPSEGGAVEGERRGPMLIYEASLQLATRQELSERVDDVASYAIGLGGFVVTQDNASIVVRVPARLFREALAQLEGFGDVLGRRVSAMDVAEQVRDLRVRLQNATNLRDRLLVLLTQASTVAESIVIEHELERLNETIALMQGQLEGLEERVAFSTITVRFQAVVEHSEVPNQLFRLPFSWLDELGLQFLLNL